MAKAPPKRRIDPTPAPTPAVAPAAPAWLLALDRHARWIAVAAVLVATLRIVSTYGVFNHTMDEPSHIATGIEWLDKGTYTWEAQHPPLARIAAALGPYLLGSRTHKLRKEPITRVEDNLEHEGLAILYEGKRYDRLLAAARLGILPFFWIACLVVYVWAGRAFGPRIAAVATVVFTFLPPVLAHAGLATTDMALTAFTAASFLTSLLFLERPGPKRAVLFGAATGLAVLSKFSSLVFLPAAAIIAFLLWLAIERPGGKRVADGLRRAIPPLAIAIATGAVVIVAGYRFSAIGALWEGIAFVRYHNAVGHQTYFFGERSVTGSPLFFPTVLALKTPLALLLLLAIGAVAARSAYRRAWLPLAFSAAILLVGIAGNINIGVRHILPVYVGLSIAAAVIAADLLERPAAPKWLSPALAVLTLWFAGSSLVSHPDYIPYFNELAGSEPEKIVVDSDLDWGQDAKRLAQRLREVGATSAVFATLLAGDFEKEHGFPPLAERMDVTQPAPGWNAISLTWWKARRLGLGDQYPNVVLWPDRLPPTEKVGKSIYLWNVR
jgi:hypothetical protein